MKHAHQVSRPKPDLSKYPMPTAETAWAIAQEFVAARRQAIEAMERYAASVVHRGNAVVDLVTDEQYQQYADEMTDLDRRWKATLKFLRSLCTCPACIAERVTGK